MKLHVVAFGCQMSSADAGELAAPLLAQGFRAASEPEDADAIILNTCTVRQHAEDRALSLIGRLKPWKDQDDGRVLIVAGCAAQRLGDWIRERFPHVDMVVGAKSIDEYPRLLGDALAGKLGALAGAGGSAAPAGADAAVCAPVTVMRGCNYSCSYCIVPSVRGREVYRPWETVLAQARVKAAAGAREILLLGQTVNSWRGPGPGGKPAKFSDLLRAVSGVEGVRRVRFESPHPRFFDDELIAAMGEVAGAGDHAHLPAQSGSDRVLALMRRNYGGEGFLALASRLRAALPRVELSTDIIVGFPTETDEDFRRTLDLVERLRPAWTYAFKYSPREGTESARALPDDVPEAVKEERLARLNALCDRFAEDALKARVGRTLEVLDENGGYGRTRDGFRVRWTGPARPGELVSVLATGIAKRTLLGECR